MKVLVCGGRKFANFNQGFPCDMTPEMVKQAEQERTLLRGYLSSYHASLRITLLIHGDASGADKAAGAWARDNGVQEVRCPANWDFHGKPAGMKRNMAMLWLEPQAVIAFPGGVGTNMMANLAQQQLITVHRVVMPA